MSEKPEKRILAVVGPTASGKSALALSLAERFGGEIVSCDSMQVYRGMDIGTAKPSPDERRRIAHHMIDTAEPDDTFTAGDYVRGATRATEDILSRGGLPVFCGGTGLYLESFLRGGFEKTRSDSELRARIESELRELGAEGLHEKLRGIDPDAAAAIHPNNMRRTVRALEIFYSTGKTKTELDEATRRYRPKYGAVIIGLRFVNRELLYERIDRRVDEMLSAGLLEEVGRLYRAGVFERSITAAQAIGYKELLGVVTGDVPLDAAVDELKRATRRYAKRQMTWFGARGDIEWIDADGRASGELFELASGIWESRDKNGSNC